MKAVIGVMPEALIRHRTRAIAQGEHTPEPGEPKVWFSPMIALAHVLSNDNIALLRMMDEQKPETLSELAAMSGRKPSNLSVTLKTLDAHGFVRLEKSGRKLKPVALFTDVDIQVYQKHRARCGQQVA